MTREAEATAAPSRCAFCGRTGEGGCPMGHGALHTFDGRGTIRVGRSLPPLELAGAAADVLRSVFMLVHARQFTGQLRWPMAAHALAFLALLTVLLAGLLPAFSSRFHGNGGNAAELWVVACALLLAPPLLDLLAGRAQVPLLEVSERAHLVAAPTACTRITPLRDQAITLAAVVAALPMVLPLTQMPWLGLPVTVLLGSWLAATVWLRGPTARSGYGLRQHHRLLWRNRWRVLGTGLALQLALFVPFLNLLLLSSLGAVAGTRAFLRFDKQPA